MDPKYYSKYDRDTTKSEHRKNRGSQHTSHSTSSHLLPTSYSNSISNKLIIDKSCSSLLQNRQKTNISIHKNDKKPHQSKKPNDLIRNKKIQIQNQISETKSGKNRVIRI